MSEIPIKFADKFNTKSSRYKNWNYSTPGYYFITICTYNHNKFFGKIENGKMILSQVGEVVQHELLNTINIRKNIIINPWVLMPNHVHLLITIRDLPVETPRGASLHDNSNGSINKIPPTITLTHLNHPEYFNRINQKSKQLIPVVINQFKSSVTRICKRQNLYFAWQNRFHDHIIIDPTEFQIIKNYIINNPFNWTKDKFFNDPKTR